MTYRKMQTINCVLGIETSCDETGIAIYHREKGLISHVLHSQADLHSVYGGVVPELAARDHSALILPLIKNALNSASMSLQDIEGIAYCQGPGLAGALLIGTTVSHTLGWMLKKPVLGVHHLEGHLVSVMLEPASRLSFPFVALLVSGGHTLLVLVSEFGHYQILGETLDDAAGEAFDKVAKLLGLGYPGGAALSELALQGNANSFRFPKPMCDQPGLDFSFSGLKTTVNRCWDRIHKDTKERANVARAFEETVVEILTIKSIRALDKTQLKNLVIVGGVSANQRLRQTLTKRLKNIGATLHCPPLEFCTDNGAMIAYAGFLRFQKENKTDLSNISVKPRWSLKDL